MSRILINIVVNDLLDKNKKQKIIIYGAGEAGYFISQKLKNYEITCFVDDDKNKINNKINNTLVSSFNDLPEIIAKYNVNLILIAIPSLNFYERNKILAKCEGLNVKIKILPKLNDFLIQDYKIDNYDFITSDFANRKIEWDQNQIISSLNDKNILITGAGGSIGSELTRQIFFSKPKSIILVDNNEYNLFKINNEITKYIEINKDYKSIKIFSYLLDVSNLFNVEKIFLKNNVNIVFHAAAYKHLFLLENNELSAFKNNVCSTFYLAKTSSKKNVEKFINISTDKAVIPTSIMGTTKFLSENIIFNFAENKNNKCIFSNVRFGNVINSRGSIIPIFKKQIENGGPVTVTDRNVTRYFMSIPEAVGLVLESSIFSSNGETFFLDMGNPIKILDIAKKMIRLNGYDYTYDSDDKSKNNILITFIGLKSGEKLHEDLSSGNAYEKTSNKFIFKDIVKNYKLIQNEIFQEEIEKVIKSNSSTMTRNFLEKFVSHL